MKTHVIIGMLIFLGGCSPRPQHVSSAGYVIVPANYIFGAVSRAGLGLRALPSTFEWKMEASDVPAVENSINVLFAKPDERLQMRCGDIFPLSDYYMQYAGVLKDGKKLIVGQGFHKLHSDPKVVLKPPDQTNSSVRAFCAAWGGGSYFFTVVYNVTDKMLVELTYNAPL